MSEPEPPLLLHSLSTFRELILGCLDAAGARRILEIGSEAGEFTLELADWVAARDGALVTVDPDPAPAVRERAAVDPRLEVVAGASPGALEGVEPGDAHIIDGDHNHWTVLRELRHAYGAGGADGGPLCIVHDVGWPSGRRDMYYAPDRIPAEGVQPHTYDGGVVPGDPGIVAHGFHGDGHFAWAQREGGERNGVRTAVDDAIAEIGGLRLAVVPCVFGVGFVWPQAAPWAAAVAERVEPYADNPLLEAMEANRLTLYLRVLERRERRPRAGLPSDRLIADLAQQVDRLEIENAALRLAAAHAPGALKPG